MKGVYCALFLGSKKLPHSIDIVENEAIVDALGYVYVRPICDSDIAYGILCIYILRGVILPLLVLLYRAVVGLLERNEQVMAPAFHFR